MNNEMKTSLLEARSRFEQMKYAVDSIADLWYEKGAAEAIDLGNDSYPFNESFNEIANRIILWCMDNIYTIESILLADKVMDFLKMNTKLDHTDVEAIEMIDKVFKNGLYPEEIWWKDINYISK